MTLKAYWWRPDRPARSLAGEVVRHGAAWSWLLRNTTGGLRNFGDAANELLISELTGHSIHWAPLGDEDVVAIGSVLNAYAAKGGSGQIIGSGVRNPSEELAGIPRDRIIGVRGLLSTSELRVGASLAIGDPGLAIRSLVNRRVRRGAKPIYVPHFTAVSNRRQRQFATEMERAGFRVEFPNSDPLWLASAIAGAPYVVATSLHAIIFADAMGVPCALLSDDSHSESKFKYLDYRSIFGTEILEVAPTKILDPTYSLVDDPSIERDSALISDRIDSVVDGLFSAFDRSW